MRLFDAFNDRRCAGRTCRPAPSARRCTSPRIRTGGADPRLRARAGGLMPELPEVETIRRHLAPHVEGRTLERCEIHDARWCRPPRPPSSRRGPGPARRAAEPARQVPGLGAERRRVPAHAPAHDRERCCSSRREPPPHTRVRFALDAGKRLAFVDPRRFGTGELLSARRRSRRSSPPGSASSRSSRDFTAAALRALARGSRAPVKAFLLDQERVAGVGQHLRRRGAVPGAHPPAAPADRLTRGADRGAARRRASPHSRPGSTAKGATIDDFRDADGASGTFQDRFLVHRREGEPCPRCGDADAQAARRRARAPTSASAASRGRGARRGLRGEQLRRGGRRGRPRAAPGSRRSAARRSRSGGRSSCPSGARARRGRSGSLARLISS